MDTRSFFLDMILQTNGVYLTFLDGSLAKVEAPTIQLLQDEDPLELTVWGMLECVPDARVVGVLFCTPDIEISAHGFETEVCDADGSVIITCVSGTTRLLCDIEGDVHKTIACNL